MKKLLKGGILGGTMALFGWAWVALADGPIKLTDPLGGQSFVDIMKSVINFVTWVSIPIVALMVLWGGFQLITSAGDPEKVSKGQKTILYAAIGFVVVLLAGGVVSIIKSVIGGQ